MPRLGHAARIRAHYRQIEQVMKAAQSAWTMARDAFPDYGENNRDDGPLLNKMNNLLGPKAPWHFGKSLTQRTLGEEEFEVVRQEINQSLKATRAIIKAGNSEHIIAMSQEASTINMLRRAAWFCELDARHEDENGDHTVDVDPITLRILALIGMERGTRYDGEFERSMIIESFPVGTLTSMTTRKMKQYARRAVQAMIDNDATGVFLRGSYDAQYDIHDPNSPISSITLHLDNGSLTTRIIFDHESLVEIKSETLVIKGAIPHSILLERLDHDLGDLVDYPLITGADLTLLSAQETSVFNDQKATEITYQATGPKKHVGLFVIGREEEGKHDTDED